MKEKRLIIQHELCVILLATYSVVSHFNEPLSKKSIAEYLVFEALTHDTRQVVLWVE